MQKDLLISYFVFIVTTPPPLLFLSLLLFLPLSQWTSSDWALASIFLIFIIINDYDSCIGVAVIKSAELGRGRRSEQIVPVNQHLGLCTHLSGVIVIIISIIILIIIKRALCGRRTFLLVLLVIVVAALPVSPPLYLDLQIRTWKCISVPPFSFESDHMLYTCFSAFFRYFFYSS